MGQFNVNKQDFLSTLTATEYNQLAELNNAITLLSGQNLDNSTLNQIAKTIIASSLAGNYYNDSGTADNYILSSATFTIAPSQYYNGMVVRFITTNANATTTPTINVSNLGVKNIKKPDGSNVVAGDINGYIELRYNGTEFLLSPISSVLNTSATNKGLVFLNQPITIANNTTDANNDIDFTAGNFKFSDNSGQAIASAMTKRLDASWTAGNNGGGLDTGTKQANTWYYCYAIYNPTTQASDFLFSASATNPTLPSGFTKYKYLGSVLTNISGNIIPFWQENNSFYFRVDDGIVNTTTPAGVLTNLTVSAPPNSKAILSTYVNIGPSINSTLFLKDLVNNVTHSVNIVENDSANITFNTITVNSSSQIQYRLSNVSLQGFSINTLGYINLNI